MIDKDIGLYLVFVIFCIITFFPHCVKGGSDHRMKEIAK